MVNFSSGALGFGRMGPNRELKFALEKYWRGDTDMAALITTANQVEDLSWDMQRDAGIEHITVGDYALYDNVLQWLEWLGIIPSRFASMAPGIDRMFAMARGVDGAPALSKFHSYGCQD
jgi:5-methyltetrahydropteroyltriglutamate--homocysteine methyltransferase